MTPPIALTDEDKKWIVDRLQQVEAKLLAACQRSHSAALRPMDAIVNSLKDRVKKIEAGQ